MHHAGDKVNGTETIEVVPVTDARGSMALRQPIPDRPELEQRFTIALVRFW